MPLDNENLGYCERGRKKRIIQIPDSSYLNRNQHSTLLFVNILSHKLNHRRIVNIELLHGTILRIDVQKSHLFTVFINKVNKSVTVTLGQPVLFVGQPQLDDNSRVVQENHVVILANLLNRHSAEGIIQFILNRGIHASPHLLQGRQTRLEICNRRKRYHTFAPDDNLQSTSASLFINRFISWFFGILIQKFTMSLFNSYRAE